MFSQSALLYSSQTSFKISILTAWSSWSRCMCELEAAIHTLKSYITTNSSKENLCCFKVDMRNAFNKCHREKFLP